MYSSLPSWFTFLSRHNLILPGQIIIMMITTTFQPDSMALKLLQDKIFFISPTNSYFSTGTTYFFQGKVFWEFDDFRMKVKPKSPALSAPFWLGCPNTKNPYFLEATITKSAAASTPSLHTIQASTFALLLCAVWSLCLRSLWGVCGVLRWSFYPHEVLFY